MGSHMKTWLDLWKYNRVSVTDDIAEEQVWFYCVHSNSTGAEQVTRHWSLTCEDNNCCYVQKICSDF